MLKETLEKLKATRVAADASIAGDFRTRPGREMAKKQAQAALPELLRAFAREFHKVGFPVFISGPGAEKFIKIASEQAEVTSVDYRKATEAIRVATKASIGKNREFGPHNFTVMLREIRQLGADLGLTSIPAPSFENTVVVTTDAEVDDVVDNYLHKHLGADMLALAIESTATRNAEFLQLDGAGVVPVFVVGVPEKMTNSVGQHLFSGKHVTVTAPEDVGTATVLKTFKEVKASVKDQSSTNRK